MSKTEYKLVTGYDPVRFESEVNHYLNKGWALSGNLAMACFASGCLRYAQGMVKEEVVDNG